MRSASFRAAQITPKKGTPLKWCTSFVSDANSAQHETVNGQRTAFACHVPCFCIGVSLARCIYKSRKPNHLLNICIFNEAAIYSAESSWKWLGNYVTLRCIFNCHTFRPSDGLQRIIYLSNPSFIGSTVLNVTLPSSQKFIRLTMVAIFIQFHFG